MNTAMTVKEKLNLENVAAAEGRNVADAVAAFVDGRDVAAPRAEEAKTEAPTETAQVSARRQKTPKAKKAKR